MRAFPKDLADCLTVYRWVLLHHALIGNLGIIHIPTRHGETRPAARFLQAQHIHLIGPECRPVVAAILANFSELHHTSIDNLDLLHISHTGTSVFDSPPDSALKRLLCLYLHSQDLGATH